MLVATGACQAQLALPDLSLCPRAPAAPRLAGQLALWFAATALGGLAAQLAFASAP